MGYIVREDYKLRSVNVDPFTHILIFAKGRSMEKHTPTETRKLEDNQGKSYYLHIKYDKVGNPICRQVSRVATPSNGLEWYY